MEPVPDDGMQEEWRPDYPVKYAPIFVWPPQPAAFLRWLFGWPGFLVPWNAIYVAITVATYVWTQPSSDVTKELALSWILPMYVRNLLLLTAVAGGWHMLLYTFKVNGLHHKYDRRWLAENDSKFTFGNQLLDNIFWSCASGVTVWTAYEVFFAWGWANGYIPVYYDFWSRPVYSVAVLLAIPFWREFHFYFVHRAIHIRAIYKYVHALHHRNVNPGPWSGMSMHPVEHVLYFSVLLLPSLLLPCHPLHLLFNAQHTALTPAGGHHGFEGPVWNDSIPTGSYFHYLHHRYLWCNYGEATLPLDWMFGTFNDGTAGKAKAAAAAAAAASSGKSKKKL